MLKYLMAGALGLSFSLAAHATTFTLDAAISCSAGGAQNGIAIGDVSGDNGGATECWGTYDGNDAGPSGDGYEIDGGPYDGATFDFVAKQNTPGSTEGDDIGLTVTPSGGALGGEWAFTPGALGGHDFLIVLKAASQPGFAVWLFAGNPDATSYSGSWSVAWGKDLSHLSVYKATLPPQEPEESVPAPSPVGLLATALLGLWGRRRR